MDQPLRPITREAPGDEGETGDGHQRIEALKRSQAKPFDQALSRRSKGCETMSAKKDDDPQKKNKHASPPPLTAGVA
jgi:hypothetical protein